MLEDISAKLKRLIAAFEAVRAENQNLAERLERSEKENEDYRKQIFELEKLNDNLKLQGAFLGTAENADMAKRKIDRLIKEIDRCISLMEG